MKKSIAVLFAGLIIMLYGVPTSASTFDDVRAGNRSYENKQYDKAIEEYSKAKGGEADSDILSFNTGTALYKQEKYEEAINAFTTSLITEDKGLEAMANYNIANSKFRLGGLKSKEALSEAINLYRQSLDHYKRAIELDKDNDDARYNHELVEKRMKVLLDRQKNQQEQENEEGEEGEEGKDQKSDNQEETGDQQSDDADKGHDEKEQETGGDQAEADKQEKEAGQESASQEEKDSSEQSGDAEEEEGKEMTPEEAKMLLKAFGDEQSLDTLEKRGRAQFRGVLKDW